jgi:hypothetical protein
MGDAGPGVRQRSFDLRSEPSVISCGFLSRRELGLAGGVLGHKAENINDVVGCRLRAGWIDPVWMR